ncbi:hypothetical protein Pfo_008160 [Paulownia fortunei]|nr:hypothetical protein Pfo_008160 [Paulownia fortunei]
MQTDGNLVQYPVNTPDAPPYAYYASRTTAEGSNVTLNLENDGRLYLLNGSSVLQNITRGGYPTEITIYLMRIDVDGIFRLYSRSLNREGKWTIRWSSTDDICVPKGVCGINAFCIQMDDVADCKCLPGFDFVQSGNWSAGCTRNFIAEGCGNKDDRVNYEIRTVYNTVWEDNSYDVLDTTTEEDCRQACLDDCNCEAAFFKEGQCTKQKLPLRFGRRSLSDPNIALIRVSTSSPNTEGVPCNSGKKIKKELRLDILIIGISLIVVGALVMAIAVIYVHRKQGAYKRITEYGEANLIEDVALQAFTYADIVQATNDFKEELGKGASGTVYKGVGIKPKGGGGEEVREGICRRRREFQTEMKTIGKIYHRNLVRLLGYYLNGPNKLLVLYMSNGSLADILFSSDKRPSWDERTKLA